MQISNVNANYTNNQQTFKGRAEQKLFMEIVEKEPLLKAARDVYFKRNRQHLVDYFTSAFEALKTAFEQKGFNVKAQNIDGKGTLEFTKTIEGAEPEDIQIHFSTGKVNTIGYTEIQALSPENVTQCKNICYNNYAEDELILMKECQVTLDINGRFCDSSEHMSVEQELNIQTGEFGKPYFNHPSD